MTPTTNDAHRDRAALPMIGFLLGGLVGLALWGVAGLGLARMVS